MTGVPWDSGKSRCEAFLSDELAVYVGDSKKLRDLQERTLQALSSEVPIRVGELLRQLSDVLTPSLRRPFIHLLLNEGIAKPLETSVSIEEYLVRVDRGLFERFSNEQIRVAEVLERVENQLNPRTSARQSVAIVSTVPPELIGGSPAPSFHAIEPSIKKIIASSKQSVWVVNPFFDSFGLSSLVPPLAGAIDRGVKVRLLTRDGSQQRSVLSSTIATIRSESRSQGAAASLEVRDLLKKSVSTGRQEYALHSKVILADDDVCYIGSANVTEHGMRHNFELGVVLRGSVVRDVRSLLERFWDIAMPVNVAPS